MAAGRLTAAAAASFRACHAASTGTGACEPVQHQRRLAAGTGSCRLMADFQARFMGASRVYIPSPTWSNHHSIWRDAGVERRTYRQGRRRLHTCRCRRRSPTCRLPAHARAGVSDD
jgi:aspartate/tyrosine/aromatic aminotransferase